MDQPPKFGLSVALATPFTPKGDVDLPHYAAHAWRCLEHGCNSVTTLGTTGENASIGSKTRQAMLLALTDSGITGNQLVVGITSCNHDDAIVQIQQANNAGAGHILLTPPFYFKGVSDAGIYQWYADLINAMGDEMPATILYNIPSQTAVSINAELISKLRADFGPTIAGVKDSSGSWASAQSLLSAHDDIAVLIGDERHLAPAVRLGGQGAICGVANMYTEKMRRVVDTGEVDEFVNSLVDILVQYPIVPALKTLMVQYLNEHQWSTVLPPFMPLGSNEKDKLLLAAGSLIT